MTQKITLIPSATPLWKIGKKKKEHYKGILIKTDEKVHAQIMSILKPYLPAGEKVSVLDWGCGAGALSQRMFDAGCRVLSIDKSKESFTAETEFETVDFDRLESLDGFVETHRNAFDIVIASEVIEHVRDPWRFLAGIRDVTKDTGVMLISTPNTAHVLSRMVFLLKGEIFSFSESDLDYGHITPISLLKMRVIARDSGCEIVSWAEGGSLPLIWLTTSPKHLVFTLFSLATRPFIKGTFSGWCLLFLLKKTPSAGTN